jgi:hypothetical protein
LGVSAALLVGAAAGLAAQRAQPPNLLDEGMSQAGDISYAIYLCHVPVVLLVYANLTVAAPWASWATAVAIALLVALPVGLFDLRLYARLRAWVERLSDRRADCLAMLFVGLFVTVAGATAMSGLAQARKQIGGAWLVSALAARANGGATAATSIVGFVEDIAWLDAGRLRVAGWAGDRANAETPVQVAVLTRERVVATGTFQQVRGDVARALGVAAWSSQPTGFVVTAEVPCAAGQDYLVVAFTAQHDFAVLQPLRSWPPCP